MLMAFSTGFFLGLSLIVAIGAQNSFVLRQGITGQHIFYVALFCALSDSLLITIGVFGVSFFLNNYAPQIINWLFGFSAVWLSGYGILRLKNAFISDAAIEFNELSSKKLLPTLAILAILTFANPHVYLDTILLIGTISNQFSAENKLAFLLGASLASFVFFFSLGYGARLLTPLMKRPLSWRILDSFIAFIMFTIAFNLASSINWI